MASVTTGMLNDEIPYLAIGAGPPLVMALGLTPTNAVPTGMERRAALSSAAPLADHFRVYVVNRKPGLRAGASMSEIAGHLATAIEQEIGEPVCLTGTSTGGSVALQLAVDRPELVRALVVVASACRLGPRGRALQQEVARLTRAGDGAAGWAAMMTAMLPPALQRPTGPLVRVMTRSMAPDDPTDLLTTLDAEDAFDVSGSLHAISAPTLVIGGAKDVFYTRELFEQTAAGVPDGRAHVFPDWGHMRTSASSRAHECVLEDHEHQPRVLPGGHRSVTDRIASRADPLPGGPGAAGVHDTLSHGHHRDGCRDPARRCRGRVPGSCGARGHP